MSRPSYATEERARIGAVPFILPPSSFLLSHIPATGRRATPQPRGWRPSAVAPCLAARRATWRWRRCRRPGRRLVSKRPASRWLDRRDAWGIVGRTRSHHRIDIYTTRNTWPPSPTSISASTTTMALASISQSAPQSRRRPPFGPAADAVCESPPPPSRLARCRRPARNRRVPAPPFCHRQPQPVDHVGRGRTTRLRPRTRHAAGKDRVAPMRDGYDLQRLRPSLGIVAARLGERADGDRRLSRIDIAFQHNLRRAGHRQFERSALDSSSGWPINRPANCQASMSAGSGAAAASDKPGGPPSQAATGIRWPAARNRSKWAWLHW